MSNSRHLSTASSRQSLLDDIIVMDGINSSIQRQNEEFGYHNISNKTKPKNILFTDNIIKFFVCVFYGIIPCIFASHKTKLYSCFFSICIVILHWYSVFGYIYCTDMFWIQPKNAQTSKNYSLPRRNNTETTPFEALPEIPLETLLLLLGLVVSGAITVTLAVFYFYTESNDFSCNTIRNFNLLPKVEPNASDSAEELNQNLNLTDREWLIANILFIFGMANIMFVLGSDFGTDTLFNFHGIRAFLKTTTPSNQAIYIAAVTMLFWGFGGTVCACCLFHIMSRRIMMLLSQTKKSMLETAVNRDDFFRLNERLIVYIDNMIDKFKYWFAIHNSMFIFLVAAMIFEWVNFMKKSKYGHNYMLSQISGTILICYKFAFPFFSASRVTVGLKDFYIEIFRRNQFKDIPELLLLQNQFGFTVFGLRITPNLAILVFFSSFLGILKFISAELNM